MIWSSAGDFFAMGGYGTYVWGSLVVTVTTLYTECAFLRRRRKAALSQIKRELNLEQR